MLLPPFKKPRLLCLLKNLLNCAQIYRRANIRNCPIVFLPLLKYHIGYPIEDSSILGTYSPFGRIINEGVYLS